MLTRSKGWRSRGSAYDQYSGSPLSPNLSTCHNVRSTPSGSIWPRQHEINCCPARPDSEQTAKDFELPSASSSPLRLRRPAHRLALDGDYLAKYNKAVALMKQLPSDHPHSFLRQANIHCLYCTGAYYRAGAAAAAVPFDIHESWLFFPFHRLYVHFHERILGKLVGDDSFALPFWNYDSPDGMPIPDIYMKGDLLDEERDGRHFPPAPAAIDYAAGEIGTGDEPPAAEQVATNLALLYHHMVSGATKPELFMGCRLGPGEEEEGCYGTIEEAPHNTLHLWAGNKTRPEYEDMGAFYSAGRDPVFYAHHANIDRMWVLWRRLNGYGGSEPEFDDPRWLDSYFYFYDENLDLVRARVRDALDAGKLGYAYEEVDLPWLDARPEPSVPPRVARSMLRAENGRDALRAATSKGPWTLEGTVRVRVARPKRSRAKEEEVLVVDGIRVEKGMYAKFDVYINLVVDETMASPRLREYAGCFVKMKGDGAMEGRRRRRKMKVGISEILEDLEADGDESIWVSLVPRGATGNVTSVDGIHIEYME